MKLKLATVLAGVLLLASVVPAGAQTYVYGDGSIKDAGPAGVPVPAPVPIPNYKADYYIRADIGMGLTDTMSASEEGIVYGLAETTSAPVGMPSSWMGDGQLPMTFGIGVGRYWSDHFRTDLTIDWVRQQKASAGGTMTFRDDTPTDVTVTTRDETKKEAGVFLLNAYYDFGAEQRRFRPYVGAGIGFALNITDRHHETDIDVVCATCDPTSGDNKTSEITLAAAAMVGFTYDLGDSILLDFNYRFLHVGGTSNSMYLFGNNSEVSFDDQNEHQLRAGIRMDIN
ncbi:MAG: porin family protein [Hyphomicrobiaceae bacterium]|nr:porin family protein [Hyphomicrobiaceae bacterium]